MYTLIAVSVVAVAAMCRRLARAAGGAGAPAAYEGFAQTEKFVAKHEHDIYDDFYAEVYDSVLVPDRHADVLTAVLDTTGADEAASVILDVGSGTGTLTAAIAARGFRVVGIDRSAAMVARCRALYPDIRVMCDDAANTMAFDRGAFSHIVCANMTVYEMADKVAFFRNCYHWLKRNGYLVVHLVDPARYDPIIAAAKGGFVDDAIQSRARERITDSEVDFLSYKYARRTEYAPGAITVTETFVDAGAAANVRRNQLTLRTESIPEMLSIAKLAGFHPLGQMRGANGDAHQYFYVFERVV
jgi:SAM-dependent methyltransferase